MSAPRAVFDTNLFLSYLLSPAPAGSAVDALFEAAAEGRFVLLMPIEVMIELNTVAMLRPRLAHRIPQRLIEELLRRVTTFANVLPVAEEAPPRVCRDPDDDFLVAATILHGASHLVTRDQDLLALGAVFDVDIVAPVAFLALLRRNRPEVE